MSTIGSHDIVIQGRSIHYYQSGSTGIPVVLLHGGGTDSAMLSWRNTLPALGERFCVYAPDWPGYGQSDDLPGVYTLEALQDTLDALLDAWQLPQAALVGLSMGGGAALGYTLTHAARVSHLVAVDTYGIQTQAPGGFTSYLFLHLPGLVNITWNSIRKDKRMTRSALRGIFANPDHVTEALVDEVFDAVQNPNAQHSFSSFQLHEIKPFGLRTSYAARAAEIHTPTLFIHGDKDNLVPLDLIRQVVDRMPHAQLEVMAQTGHWPPREHPDQFNQLVSDFLCA